jgi:hypothetical protein
LPTENPRLGKLAKTLFGEESEDIEEEKQVQTDSEAKSDVWSEALKAGQTQPRISFVSPKAKVVLTYLRKTTPEFNISKITASIVEEGMREKYPALWKRID